MFDRLEAVASAVKELGAQDVAAWSDDELDEAVVDAQRLLASMHACAATITAEWERRKTWRRDGSRSAAAHLARRSRSRPGECGSLIWLGRVLCDMALVAAAFSAGDITADHVRRLAAAYNPRTREAFSRDEAELVSLATEKTFLEFSIALDCWLLDNDPDGSSQSAQDQRDRRDVWLVPSFDGMHLGKMTLDPVSGSIVAGELRRLEEQLFDSDWREATERLGRTPKASELRRSPAQRRADALVEMAARSARPKAGSAPRPLFSVVMGPKALDSLCQLGCGKVISPTALLSYLDEAQIEAVLFDAELRPIKITRRRCFDAVQRRIIELRDGFCRCGCGTPAELCQMDHVVPYTAGGETAVGNGQALCRPSNRHKGRRLPPLP
ncbi:MAG: DUF222 domain-containing protein [Acidimicrobiia bacterium]